MQKQVGERILVTGGCGFIGGHFVRWLLEKSDASVVVIDKLTYAADFDRMERYFDGRRAAFVRGDIGDKALLDRLMREYQFDKILNFAAESHVDRSIDKPEPFISTNVLGAHRLVEAAFQYWNRLSQASRKSNFRFLQISTDEVYGSCHDAAFTEQQAYQPTSPYAASKAAADHLVMSYHRTFGLPVLISVASNNFGPYQYPEKLIPLMIHQAVLGKPLPIYGTGQQRRDWLFVEDHCLAVYKILKHGTPGQSYNIASGHQTTNLQLVKNLCRIIENETGCDGLLSNIRFVVDRPGHDHCYHIDASKLSSKLNWSPSQSFDRRLRETVRWYLQNQDWVANKRGDLNETSRPGLRGITSEGNQS